MKKIFLLAVITTLSGICMTSCRTSYTDACHMSDLIRAYYDATEQDTTSCGKLFRELYDLNLRELSKKPVNLSKYVYGY